MDWLVFVPEWVWWVLGSAILWLFLGIVLHQTHNRNTNAAWLIALSVPMIVTLYVGFLLGRLVFG